MIAAAFPALQPVLKVDNRVASVVRLGLALQPKRLPAWLFYDEAGSRLFDAITELPEYYLTRVERNILAANALEIVAQACGGARVRIVELGAGSAEKTRLLLKAAIQLQRTVLYEPVDVSASALETARERIQREIPGVVVAPRVADFTRNINGHSASLCHREFDFARERRMVLFIGSSIGNFEPSEARQLLRRVRLGLRSGDCFLLGVDLVKDETTLIAAYNDAAGVTAAFNRNLLVRLNRELDADFDPESFAHRAVWNAAESRIEMHLASRVDQSVRLGALDMTVDLAAGESIHTENSYKYRPGQAGALLAEAGFCTEASWTDERGWFAVYLGRAA